MKAVQHLKNKRFARSQPGELNSNYLKKRELLNDNSAVESLDIKIKKKKIHNPRQQAQIISIQ